MSRPLRFWLSLGLSTLVALAVMAVTLVVLGVLVPRLNTEVEAQNRVLSKAAAAQIDRFLEGFFLGAGQARRRHRRSLSRP